MHKISKNITINLTCRQCATYTIQKVHYTHTQTHRPDRQSIIYKFMYILYGTRFVVEYTSVTPFSISQKVFLHINFHIYRTLIKSCIQVSWQTSLPININNCITYLQLQKTSINTLCLSNKPKRSIALLYIHKYQVPISTYTNTYYSKNDSLKTSLSHFLALYNCHPSSNGGGHKIYAPHNLYIIGIADACLHINFARYIDVMLCA